MFWRYGVPLIIAGVFAALLVGWAVAYYFDRRDRREEAEAEAKAQEEQDE